MVEESNIQHPNNKNFRELLEKRALERFKSQYGRYDKRITKKGFRSYKITWNGCLIYIETTYKSGCKCGQTYDANIFIV